MEKTKEDSNGKFELSLIKTVRFQVKFKIGFDQSWSLSFKKIKLEVKMTNNHEKEV